MTECQWCRLDNRRGFHSPDWCACLMPPTGLMNIATVYTTGACSKCGRFVARIDTGRCEMCSRPWVTRPKETHGKATA